jgi:hypothetical protein
MVETEKFGPKQIIEREGYKLLNNKYFCGMQFPACCGVFIIYCLVDKGGFLAQGKDFEDILKVSEKQALDTSHSTLLFFINQTQFNLVHKIIEERGYKLFHDFLNPNSRNRVYGYIKDLP